MPEFLSVAWLAALDDAARCAPAAPDVAPFVIEQVVTDAGAEVATYHLVFSVDGLRVLPGATSDADVSFATDLATATELARGDTNAQQALAAGRFRIRGNLDSLTRRAAGLRALADVFAAVRADTTYR